MHTISIKSHAPEKTIPLLTNAIEREKRIIRDILKTTRGRVESLAKELGVDIGKLMRGEVDHAEADDMKLLELEGETVLLRQRENELRKVEALSYADKGTWRSNTKRSRGCLVPDPVTRRILC